MNSEFKELNSFDDRLKESSKILNKYTDKIPVIIERYKTKNLTNIDKKKYLLPKEITVGQLLFIIRKKISLSSEQAIYLFSENDLLSSNTLIIDLYNKHKDDDKFLYLFYDTENTFGYKH
tara:strand:+ start:1712 stop:2071 length:360 start_codon:yes stop_codon:yes gene_type:complete